MYFIDILSSLQKHAKLKFIMTGNIPTTFLDGEVLDTLKLTKEKVNLEWKITKIKNKTYIKMFSVNKVFDTTEEIVPYYEKLSSTLKGSKNVIIYIVSLPEKFLVENDKIFITIKIGATRF